MDPTCRTCSDYPCSCGHAIGVPIDNGPDKPATIRAGVGSDLSETKLEDYQAQQERGMREHAERRKEAQRQAQEEKNQKVKEWMDEEGADKPEIAHLYLAWSAITGDVQMCKQALARGANYDECFDVTLFHDQNKCKPNPSYKEPSFVGRISSCVSPMYHNSISEQVGLGLRAIHIASAFGHVEIVKILLDCAERSVNPDYVHSNAGRSLLQFSPLHYAIRNEQVEVVKALRASGANPAIDDAYGVTALKWAMKTNNQALIDAMK